MDFVTRVKRILWCRQKWGQSMAMHTQWIKKGKCHMSAPATLQTKKMHFSFIPFCINVQCPTTSCNHVLYDNLSEITKRSEIITRANKFIRDFLLTLALWVFLFTDSMLILLIIFLAISLVSLLCRSFIQHRGY